LLDVYDFFPFFVTGWRGKSEKNQKRQSKLGRKIPYRKCLIASKGPFLTAAENYIIMDFYLHLLFAMAWFFHRVSQGAS